MKLYEYHAKRLFADYGIPVPDSQLVTDNAQVEAALAALGGDRWIIKAQSLAGRSRLDGYVRWAVGVEHARLLVGQMFKGDVDKRREAVAAVLIERPAEVQRHLYLAMSIDPLLERIVCMAADTGGASIDVVAREKPELVFTEVADIVFGFRPYHCRQMAQNLGLTGALAVQLSQVMSNAYRLFVEKELLLLEISPLAIIDDNQLSALNAKLVADSNASFRQRDLGTFGDVRGTSVVGLDAQGYVLTDVPLQGNIGCILNGAGLAMATLDLIRLPGEEPACVLDISGRSNEQEVAEAYGSLLDNPQVDVLLVNIFGGIVRCDMVARGMLVALRLRKANKPTVVRFAGTNAKEGLMLLNDSEFGFRLMDGFQEAVAAVVDMAKKGRL
ncbi:MAG: acetate--CoA ligase family protein [Gammaproteobacteria bacterium]|nr:acetate--CoA ligase family protein [Gammaproteobacteria bacterium]